MVAASDMRHNAEHCWILLIHQRFPSRLMHLLAVPPKAEALSRREAQSAWGPAGKKELMM